MPINRRQMQTTSAACIFIVMFYCVVYKIIVP